MMIKFRAWDNRYKEYIENVLVDWHGKVYFDDGVATQDDLDISVEQFTGLKDVNGKEIYIGDIVKYRNLDEKYQYLKIRWLQQDCMADAGGYRIDIVARRCEVIGNVHENPELLEEDE